MKWRKTRKPTCCKYCGRYVGHLRYAVKDDFRFCCHHHRVIWVLKTLMAARRLADSTAAQLIKLSSMCYPFYAKPGELNDRERVVCFVGWLYRKKHPYIDAVTGGTIVLRNRDDYLNWLFAIGQHILGQIAGLFD